MTDSKEKILSRIREALRAPAPTPAQIYGRHENVPAKEYSRDFRDAMPPAGTTSAERGEIFAKNLAALAGKLVECASIEDAQKKLDTLRAERGWNKIATHHAPLCDAVVRAPATPIYANDVEPIYTDFGYDKHALEAVDVGISECECLVAQTGSVMFSSKACGGRALAILPPVHIVLAKKSQLVGDLTDAYAHVREKYGENLPDCLGFITGPSRTGDIERILVLGAHGPKELFVFLID